MTLILQGTDNSVSSPAVQGGTAGTTTGVYYPASNQLALATNGSLALLADSSQNIGIGGTTPAAWGGYKGIQFPAGTALVGNSSSPSMILAENIYSTNGGSSWTYVTTNPATLGVYESNFYRFYSAPSGTAGTTATITNSVTMNPYGVGLGNGTTPSSGLGITFPATQSASSDANTLDDYEEGSWTPAFVSDGGTTGTTTVTNRWGRYTKIGRQVTVTFGWTGTLSGFTGVLYVGSMPFTAVSDSPYQFGGSFNCASSTATGSNNTNFMFFSYLNSLYPRYTTGQTNGYLFTGSTQINGLTEIEGTMTYFTS